MLAQQGLLLDQVMVCILIQEEQFRILCMTLGQDGIAAPMSFLEPAEKQNGRRASVSSDTAFRIPSLKEELCHPRVKDAIYMFFILQQ